MWLGTGRWGCWAWRQGQPGEPGEVGQWLAADKRFDGRGYWAGSRSAGSASSSPALRSFGGGV